MSYWTPWEDMANNEEFVEQHDYYADYIAWEQWINSEIETVWFWELWEELDHGDKAQLYEIMCTVARKSYMRGFNDGSVK